jgi:hypothetical protein
VDGVVMEGETAETLGGVRLLRRAGELAWVRAEVNRPGFGGGIDPTKGWSHVSTAEVPA